MAMPRVIVVGGGISGLTTAYLLGRCGLDVELLEPGRLGGTIATVHEDGYLCEAGPNAFLDAAKDTMALVQALGLTSLGTSPDARKRYLYFRGRLHGLPMGPPGLLGTRLLSLRGKLRLLREPFIPPRRAAGDAAPETVFDFVSRRLGREVAERLAAPAVAGIYAGDPRTLAVAQALPRLARLEAEHGSLLRGLLRARKTGQGAGKLRSFTRGMAELIQGLAAALSKPARAQVATALECPRAGRGSFCVRTAAGSELFADAVALALPATQMGALLGGEAADALRQIPYAPIDVLCLGYRRQDIAHDLAGFGFLVAPGAGLPLLGCLWESSLFEGRAPPGHVLLRVMTGGMTDLAAAELSEAALVARTEQAIAHALGARGKPTFRHLFRHPHGIPQYTVGHRERLETLSRVEAAHPGLFLLGNALRGVGVNDCIREAHRVVERIAAFARAGSAVR